MELGYGSVQKCRVEMPNPNTTGYTVGGRSVSIDLNSKINFSFNV